MKPKLKDDLTPEELPAPHLITPDRVLKKHIVIEALHAVMREAREEGRPFINNQQDRSDMYTRAIVWLQDNHGLSNAFVDAAFKSNPQTRGGALRCSLSDRLSTSLKKDDGVFPIAPGGFFNPDYAGYVPKVTSTDTQPTNTQPIEAALVEVSTAVDMLAGALKELAEAITTHTQHTP